MSKQSENHLGYSEIVTQASSRNTDKVIHQDLKEVEFDDVVLSAVALESEKLRYSIVTHSQKLCEHTEYEISQHAQPVLTDQLLRVSFWDEVNTALAENRSISERKIWTGICSNAYWMRVRDELEWKMAYVLTPVLSYQKANKLGLELGQRAMLAILNAPNVDPKTGEIKDKKLAALQHQIWLNMQDRTYGKAVQRIQSHNTNVEQKKESIEDLQKEIAALEGKVKTTTIEVAGE